MDTEKKKWWQYKKMGTKEIGTTTLVLLFLGFMGLIYEGNGQLIGVGVVFGFVWIYLKLKNKGKSN